jgi:hypothetical protein
MGRPRSTTSCKSLLRFRQFWKFALHPLPDCLTGRLDRCHVVQHEHHWVFNATATFRSTGKCRLLHHVQLARCSLCVDTVHFRLHAQLHRTNRSCFPYDRSTILARTQEATSTGFPLKTAVVHEATRIVGGVVLSSCRPQDWAMAEVHYRGSHLTPPTPVPRMVPRVWHMGESERSVCVLMRISYTNVVADYIFLLLTIIYIANVVIRIVGLSWHRFRKSSWDVFSLFAVSGTFITSILIQARRDTRSFTQLNKLFLVSLALLLIPRNNQLDQLFKTAAASLNAIANLLATWFVLFLVYAIALTQTFGLTKFGPNESGNKNFRTVPKALVFLFTMSMGEGWNQLMEDFANVDKPYCTVGKRYFNSDCGSPEWARALFITWNILSMYIFVNLFVSLIYESFSYVYQRSSGLSVISREEIRRFKQAWAEFDPNGTGYISREVFPRLLGVSASSPWR